MKEFFLNQLNKKSTKLIFLFLIFMFIAYLCGFLFANLLNPNGVALEWYLDNIFTITDAENYLKIAKNGYVTTGNDKYILVFFPMFPLMIRLLHTITFLDYPICSYIISLVSSCVSIVLLYKIALLDYDEEKAYNISLVYILYPVTTFMITGLNEGAFLMFLFATVYNIRKKNFLLAGIFGYMVALTRLPGLCVGALMLVETILYIIRSCKKRKFKLKNLIKRCCMMLMTLLGLATYLGINYYLYNDFFKFFDYQQEIWYQTVSNPIHVIFDVIINGQIKIGLVDIGVSNLVACIAILLSMIYGLYKKVRISYIFYMLVYFWVCYSASWLLSGARYSLGAFVIFIALGIFISEHKKIRKVFYPLYFLLFIFVSCLCTNTIIY